jgi:hypothetical protein
MNKEKSKKLIKAQLWPRGYSVKDMQYIVPGFDLYDLVINGKEKVKIIEEKNQIAAAMAELVETKNYDVLACIIENKKYYASKEHPVFTTNHRKIFGVEPVKNDILKIRSTK